MCTIIPLLQHTRLIDSSAHHLPATPSHPALLPSLSPTVSTEQTPAPLTTLPPHLQHIHHHHLPLSQPRLGLPRGQAPPSHTMTASQGSMGPPLGQGHNGQMNDGSHGQANVFGNVMGPAPGQSQTSAQTPQTPIGVAQVYASVYMGVGGVCLDGCERGDADSPSVDTGIRSYDTWYIGHATDRRFVGLGYRSRSFHESCGGVRETP